MTALRCASNVCRIIAARPNIGPASSWPDAGRGIRELMALRYSQLVRTAFSRSLQRWYYCGVLELSP